MTLDAIKEAISALPEAERHDLASWINELEYDEWDREMVRDFTPGGRGAGLVERVKREIAEGRAAPLSGGLVRKRSKIDQRLP